MKRVLLGIKLTLVFAAVVQAASFTLIGNERKDVTTRFTNGWLYDNSVANFINSGSVYYLYTYDNSIANIYGRDGYTTVYNSISTFDVSNVNLYEGSHVSYLNAYNNTIVNVSGGKLSGSSLYNSSTVNISNGYAHLVLHDNSTVRVFGGSGSTIDAYDTSKVNISGGNIDSVNGINMSTVYISGGSIDSYLHVFEDSQITMSGGTIAESVTIGLSQNAILVLDGTNFAIDGIPFGLGEIKSMFGGYYGDEPYRRLTGILANGDIINNQFLIGENAKIALVPEPCTLLVLGFGGIMLRRR